jgi:tetratricopeptide (TPR) repeat protein
MVGRIVRREKDFLMKSRVGLTAVALLIAALVPLRSQPQSAPQNAIFFRIIVVESADAARRVLDQLAAGENFVALAQKVSVDPSAANGGLVGPVQIADLRGELRTGLEGLRVGSLSGVVRLPTGFAILKAVPAEEAGGSSVAIAPAAGGIMTALSAAGGVKYVFDISGYIETVLSLRQVKGRQDADENMPTLCQVRKQLFASAQGLVAKTLSAPAGVAPVDLAVTYFLKGQLHSYEGQMVQAIEAFEQALRIAVSDEPDLRPQMEEALGVAHLHKAEIENGVFHTPGERCLLSEHMNGGLANNADVAKALDYFTQYLTRQPEDLEVRWLLNVAHMFAGSYPDKVPKAQLIPADAFKSAEDVGRFVDVAAQSGLASFGASGGVIVDDFDNDGRLDVLTSSIESCEPLRLFKRAANGLFSEQSAKTGLRDQLGGLNMLQTDYNNDGNLDILVLRGAWETPQRKSLVRNNGDGTFTDVTVASGLTKALTGSQAGVWTDIDNDGLLDLFVGNESSPAQLFRNKGDGTFEDIAAKAGVNRSAFSKGVTAADYDNDGWPDLYVSNLGGTNFLYRNNRNGTFTESAEGARVPGPGQGFPTWFFDYDNDGFPDIFVGSFVTSVDEVARAYLKLPRNGNTLKLYRNLGDGSFQDVTRQVGLDRVLMVMGANFGDIDNDGFLDLYLGTGNPSYAALVPSQLFRNKDGKSFVDVTSSSGTGELHKGHGVAFADLDYDGDEEIVFEVGGATPGDAHALRLFENPGHRNDWVSLKLVGVKTNRAAIGARITVTVNGPGGRRSIHRTVGSGGSFGASPLQQHVGLGSNAGTVDVEVWWPTSNTRQRFSNIGKNRFLEITEFADTYKPVERPPLPLRASK